jgi:hypothetical protein
MTEASSHADVHGHEGRDGTLELFIKQCKMAMIVPNKHRKEYDIKILLPYVRVETPLY